MLQKMNVNRFCFLFMILVSISASITVFAQNNSMTFSKTAEYDIGFKCPVASTLDPSGTQIWFLMDDCRGWFYTLAVYQIADGSLVDMPDFADELEPLNLYDDEEINQRWVSAQSHPMAFTPEGDLSIRYTSYNYNEDTGTNYTIIIPVASGGDATFQENPTWHETLLQYDEYYADYAVYNHDHTQIAVQSDSSVYVIDVASESEIVEIEVEGENYTNFLSFSDDNATLHVLHLNVPDPVNLAEDPTTILSIYSLPDSELLNQYDLPSYRVWVHADVSLAALNVFDDTGADNGLAIMDLATGDMSQPLEMNEEPVSITQCLNTGQSTTDYNYVSTGEFQYNELHWLADNTLLGGFSFGGDGFNDCYFNYSRLRIFSVGDN